MASTFDSFEQSALGAFTQSALGARGGEGRVIFTVLASPTFVSARSGADVTPVVFGTDGNEAYIFYWDTDSPAKIVADYYDITDRENPSKGGTTLEWRQASQEHYITGDTMFATEGELGTFKSWDIAVRATPVIDDDSGVGRYESGTTNGGVDPQDSTQYFAASGGDGAFTSGRVDIFDISNSSSISVSATNTADFTANSDIQATAVVQKPGTTSSLIYVFDFGSPSRIRPFNDLGSAGTDITHADISNVLDMFWVQSRNLLLIAEGANEKLIIYDLDADTVLSSTAIAATNPPRAVVAIGSKALISVETSITVVDFTDASNPTVESTGNLSGTLVDAWNMIVHPDEQHLLIGDQDQWHMVKVD